MRTRIVHVCKCTVYMSLCVGLTGLVERERERELAVAAQSEKDGERKSSRTEQRLEAQSVPR